MLLIEGQGYVGGQPDVNDWGTAKQVTTHNALVKALAVVYKGTAAAWVEIHDSSNAAVNAATHANAGVARYTVPVTTNTFINIANSWFAKGVYVRVMDAASGGSVIAGNDAKITCEYTTWPVSA